MIGFLRFVGILNAAVWFGAAIFFTFGASPAVVSTGMQALLGRNFPYFSGAIFQLVAERYFQLQLICAIVALLHLTAEWLYLGKDPQKFWLGLVLGLCLASLVGGWWFQPKMNQWHRVRFGLYSRPAQRQAAERAFRAWQTTAHVVNLLSIAGLAVYLWRVANPPDPTRFLSAAKFRS